MPSPLPVRPGRVKAGAATPYAALGLYAVRADWPLCRAHFHMESVSRLYGAFPYVGNVSVAPHISLRRGLSYVRL